MTYQELQEYVRERLGIAASDTSRETLIQRMLNADYSAVAVRSEATLRGQTFTLTNATPTVTMAADVAKVKAVVTGAGLRLTPVTVSRMTFLMSEYTGSDAPATPSYYMVLAPATGVQIRVWPTPVVTDAAATAFVVVRPPAMSASGDVPSAIPEEYHHAVIGERVVQRVALAEQETALAATAGALADEAFLALSIQVRDRNGELDSAIRATGDVGQPAPVMLGQAAR